MAKEVLTPIGEIPKILHQTYISEDTIPEHWASSHEACLRLVEENEGWSYRFWSDQDNRALVEEHYPWFLEQYDAYPKPIQRADAVRPFILHKYGGIYLDLDLEPKDSLVQLHDMYKHHDVAISQNRPGNGVGSQNLTNAFMMSQPGAKFWEYVWRMLQDPACVRPWKGFLMNTFNYYDVIMRTGPGTVCDAAYLYEKDGYEMARIPGELTQPGYLGNPLPYQTPESALIVLRGSSWHEGDAHFWQAMRYVPHYAGTIAGVMVGLFAVLFIVFLVLWMTTPSPRVRRRLVAAKHR